MSTRTTALLVELGVAGSCITANNKIRTGLLHTTFIIYACGGCLNHVHLLPVPHEFQEEITKVISKAIGSAGTPQMFNDVLIALVPGMVRCSSLDRKVCGTSLIVQQSCGGCPEVR